MPGLDEADALGGGFRQVDHAALGERSAVVDADHHRLAVALVGDPDLAAEGQAAVRRGELARVEGFAAGGEASGEARAVIAGVAAADRLFLGFAGSGIRPQLGLDEFGLGQDRGFGGQFERGEDRVELGGGGDFVSRRAADEGRGRYRECGGKAESLQRSAPAQEPSGPTAISGFRLLFHAIHYTGPQARFGPDCRQLGVLMRRFVLS